MTSTWLKATAVLLLMSIGCGRHKLDGGELERNRLFAEMLRREDRRAFGDDGFLQTTLERSPHPEARVWAVMALGRIGDPRALPWLREALKSPYAAVRAAAAFAAGEVESPEAAPDLVARLDDPSPQVRMRAAEALGKVGASRSAGEIVRLMERSANDGSPEARAVVGLAATALGRLKEGSEALQRLARGPDPELQWRACNALRRMGARDACATFATLLESEHPDVRAHAARALGGCSDPRLAARLRPLVAAVDSTTGRRNALAVRVSALQALGILKHADAIPEIRAALAAEPIARSNPVQVQFAIEAAATLGKIGSVEGEPALRALVDAGGPVANAAVVALGTIRRGDDARFFSLVDGGAFSDPTAIRAWARALGEVGGAGAIERLHRILIRSAGAESAAAEVLAVPTVLESLARAGAPDIDATLAPFLVSQDGVVLRAAVSAYLAAHKDDPSATPGETRWGPLARAYAAIAERSEAETKVAILEALEPWALQPAVERTLRQALCDRQRNARLAAARILRKAGAAGVPDDVGPSESAATELTYDLVASARRERTVAVLETERGRIEIELFREEAPLTVANFVALVRRGFYDGLTFMRVVPTFVVQGGDPRNDQEGGPGYTIRCEINMRPYERGSVGMALAGKDTGGSQFFITLAPQPHLDGGYTNFGRVCSGMTAVDRLVAGERILKAWIREDRTILDFRRY